MGSVAMPLLISYILKTAALRLPAQNDNNEPQTSLRTDCYNFRASLLNDLLIKTEKRFYKNRRFAL